MFFNSIIWPSNSPWASPVVVVRKKDCGLRFCTVFFQLNTATIEDMHPLPSIDDLLDALHGAWWFTTLDLKSGHWQLLIREEYKHDTAFWDNNGKLYELNHLPFGLCNVLATVSCLMDHILSSLNCEMCLFYLVGIIVFSKTWMSICST